MVAITVGADPMGRKSVRGDAAEFPAREFLDCLALDGLRAGDGGAVAISDYAARGPHGLPSDNSAWRNAVSADVDAASQRLAHANRRRHDLGRYRAAAAAFRSGVCANFQTLPGPALWAVAGESRTGDEWTVSSRSPSDLCSLADEYRWHLDGIAELEKLCACVSDYSVPRVADSS